MRRLIPYATLAILLAIGTSAFGQVIYDNGAAFPGTLQYGIVTNPGGGFGGGDASVLTPPDTILGFGFNGGIRLADDFVVPIGQTWTITGFHTFGYTTNATVPATTAAVLRFLDGAPNAGGNVLAGDPSTNVLTSALFPNIYRAGSATRMYR